MSESAWAPTPAADTLGTIQKAVAGYVLQPEDDEVQETATMGVRRAIDRMNSRLWNWALTYSTITFIVAQQEYTLDTGFKQPRNFDLRDTAGVPRDRLMYLQWGTFLKECQWDFPGTPNYYSGANVNYFGVIRLDVSPIASFVATYPTGRLWYYRRIQYPGSTGVSLDVPSEAAAYLQAYAEGYAADRYAPQKAQPAYARAERALHELIVDDCHHQQSDWE